MDQEVLKTVSLTEPCGVDVDGEGRIIVADTRNHRIQVFENDGSFIRSFGSRRFFSEINFAFLGSVVVDGDGNIAVSDTVGIIELK